jgi:catechol-2,3-dioxygenase
MAPAVVGLDHLALEVRDLERAERFYTALLGLEVATRIGSEQVLLRCGATVLALMRNPRAPVRTEEERRAEIANPFGKGHLCFRTTEAGLREALQEWPQRGIPVHGPVDWGDHACLYFLDPEGNLLEISTPPRG